MLKEIKKDKWKHFFVGIAMGLLFQALVLHYFPHSVWFGSMIAFVLIVFICYGFEVLSLLLKKGHYDVWDAVAGVLGGMLGMVIVAIVF